MSLDHPNRDLAAAAHWPPGFKDRANAQAAAIVERDNAPDVATRIIESFPMFLSDAITAARIPFVNTETMQAVMDALKACIKSVTVTTEGTVTVVDHRTVVG